MCGIAGIMNFNGRVADRKILHRMDVAERHRGPDGHGEIILQNVGLANRRLAIIDTTSAGAQPMSTVDKKFWITFNGEIFNYRILRKDLENSGFRFHSDTDTEVILNGYIKFGPNIVNKLIGQFAFCIWDGRDNSLFLARDQIGINPLYYSVSDGVFLFASEVKSIIASGLVKRQIDPQAIHHYLSMFVVPAPLTIFRDIKALLPGTYLRVKSGKIVTKKYWRIPVGLWQGNMKSESQIQEQLRDQLVTSIRDGRVADVPVGAFLSGGLDSSLIVAISAQLSRRPIRTFSLYTPNTGSVFDERKYALMVARKFGTLHQEITVEESELLKELPEIVYAFDQPTGGSLETYFVSKAASRKVKAAVSGLGGDELFSGYHANILKTRRLAAVYQKIPPIIQDILLKIISFIPVGTDVKKVARIADEYLNLPAPWKRYLYLYFAYQDKEKQDLYNINFIGRGKPVGTLEYFSTLFSQVKNKDLIDQFAYVDLSTYTRDDLLIGVNMMSMANSLEIRVPFLDPRLIEFSALLPPHLKYKHGLTKYILRRVAKKWLPEEVINHQKVGFALPRTKYMRTVLTPYIKAALRPEAVAKRGIFNPQKVSEEVTRFYAHNGKKMLWSEHLRVWSLFILEIWCRIYIDRKQSSPYTGSLNDLLNL